MPAEPTTTDTAPAETASSAAAAAGVKPTETAAAEAKPPETAPAESTPPAGSAADPQTPPRSSALAARLSQLDASRTAEELGIGELLLKDLMSSLARPGRDPREDLPAPIFRRGIIKLEDLEPGMELSGTVLNVVDFGAFLDIGLSDTGLVHISRLADRYVKDPHEVVSVGDVRKVWVVEIDKKRRRVSLTAIDPAAEKPKRERSSGGGRHGGQRHGGQGNKAHGNKPAGRPPSGQRSRGGRKDQRSQRKQRPTSYETKPKGPVKPITKEMKEGSEPMRSFSDLAQFFTKPKKDDEETQPPSDS